MITKIHIESFKSLENLKIELGRLNIFIGANGSGKSNFLEAVGVLSAAADGKVTDQTLLQRGVRPGVPNLYKSSFPGKRQIPHLYLSAYSGYTHYDVCLHNPLKDPSPAWKFKTELLKRSVFDKVPVTSRSPRMKNKSNTENGLAALKIAELPEEDVAGILIRRLQQYVIYSPTTPVLRGVAPETQPRQPLGLSGGRMPEAVHELLLQGRRNLEVSKVCKEALALISWASNFGSAMGMDSVLSPSASSSPRVIRFVDKYMLPKRNVLSGYDASEGALYVLFLAVLAAHPKSPAFFAIDNADHGLNPGLAKSLFSKFSEWVLSSSTERQILLTTHNPAVLDGLPLQDSRVRLFAVDRDNLGKTIIKRVSVDDRMLALAEKGWTLSRMWMSKRIGGMPDV